MSKITNKIVFNPPSFDFSRINSFKDQIIYIPKINNNDSLVYIPCLFVVEYDCCSNFLIYFHGNAEDIFSCELIAFHLSRELKMNIILVEYSGYSIYPGVPESNSILGDSLVVYDFIKKKFKLKSSNIFVCGRSLGSAPSIFLATQREIQTLILISAFESIKKVGKGFCAGFLFEDIFRSIDLIPNVKCPTLFIHGEDDRLINWNHSLELYRKCGAEEKNKYFEKRKGMTHNESEFNNDILTPIRHFISSKIKIENIKNYFNIEDESIKQLYVIPDFIKNFLEGKILDISSFINYNKIPADEHTCILPISKDIVIFSIYSEVKISIFGEIKITIKLDKMYVIYFLLIEEGKFLLITNTGIINFYSFDQVQAKLLYNFPPFSKAKIAIRVDNIFYILGEELTKIEMIKQSNRIITNKALNNIHARNLSLFNDILQITKKDIILSSTELGWLVKISLENYSIISVRENNNFIDNHCLYKLTDDSFGVIEKSGITIFDSEKIITIFNIPNNSICYYTFNYQLTCLYIIDEKTILIGDNKGSITQYNLKKRIKGNVLSLSNSDIISFSLINKKYLVALAKNSSFNEGISYHIDIRKVGKKKNQENCNLF